ncbi:MAG: hypothetical protein LBT52_01360 [Clostridiales Family XIII bacterium]|jgi:hypothetical protein|nr:hypothetical protein [Clostridiales Family XIII bacterium]
MKNAKRFVRIGLDIGLITAFILLFYVKETGVQWHILIGFAMLAMIAGHLALNWGMLWSSILYKIKNRKRAKRITIAVTTLCIAVGGVWTATTLTDYLPQLSQNGKSHSADTNVKDKDAFDKDKSGGTYDDHTGKKGEDKS